MAQQNQPNRSNTPTPSQNTPTPSQNTPTPTGSPLSDEQKKQELGQRPEPYRVDEKVEATRDTQRVDLHNPTPAIRVIYDGIPDRPQRCITVNPGETKRDVVLHNEIVRELKARTRGRGREKSDLVVLTPGARAPGDKDDDGDDE